MALALKQDDGGKGRDLIGRARTGNTPTDDQNVRCVVVDLIQRVCALTQGGRAMTVEA